MGGTNYVLKKAHILGRFKTKREAVKARKVGEEEFLKISIKWPFRL